MSKPRLLDLFCGAGGAAMGYSRAGFEVVGVDIKPQPHYCGDEFHQADWREWASGTMTFDVLHASPPCPRYSSISRVHGTAANHPDLVGQVREVLIASGLPYVIENVGGAPLRDPVMLCGSMFGLGVTCDDGQWRQLRRHRLFETPVLMLTPNCQHDGEPIGVYGHGGGQVKTARSGLGTNRGYMGRVHERGPAMGIDWMTVTELSQAIPPAYTEWIGRQLMAQLETNP
jgi:DNA (cytosine-5)-methyltransferase 1